MVRIESAWPVGPSIPHFSPDREARARRPAVLILAPAFTLSRKPSSPCDSIRGRSTVVPVLPRDPTSKMRIAARRRGDAGSDSTGRGAQSYRFATVRRAPWPRSTLSIPVDPRPGGEMARNAGAPCLSGRESSASGDRVSPGRRLHVRCSAHGVGPRDRPTSPGGRLDPADLAARAQPRSFSFSGSYGDSGMTVARCIVPRTSISTVAPTSASSGRTIASASDFPTLNP